MVVTDVNAEGNSVVYTISVEDKVWKSMSINKDVVNAQKDMARIISYIGKELVQNCIKDGMGIKYVYVSSDTKKVLKETQGESITFHRAFDMCKDPFQALEDIIELGCDRILTSGQQPTAEEGIPLIKKLVEQAAGRIIIMPGCGINPQNIRKIAEETGATEFHFSGRKAMESPMKYRNSKVSMGGTVKIDEYSQMVTDAEVVRAAIKALTIEK